MRYPTRTLGLATLLLTLLACGGSETSEEHIARAREFLDNSQRESAIIELKNALQKDGDLAEARWLLGQVELSMGKTLSAEKELRTARRLGWPADDTTPALARALLAQGKYVQIRELETDQLSPTSQGQVYAVKALSELAQGEAEAADKLIEKAREQAGESLDVKMATARILAARGDTDEAAEVLQSVIEEAPDHGPGWTLMGDIRMHQHRPDDALAAYSAAVEAQPENFSARLRRALINLQSQEYAAAREDAVKLIQLKPRHPGSNYVLGLLHFQSKEYSDAVTTLTQAEPAHRQFPMLLFYLGSSHLVLGNQDSATNYAIRFVELAPENIAGRKLLATLRLKQGKYPEVQTLIKPVLDSNPGDLGALNLMANALIRDGKTDEGISLLVRLAELQPDSAQAQVRLGAGLLLSGGGKEATHHIESALALDPEFQQADILLVLNHMRTGDFDSAIEAGKNFAGRNPASVTPHNLLGRVYLAAGRTEDAREAFARALAIDEGDPGANHNLARMALAAGDLDAARKYYQAVLAVHRDFLPTLLHLARLEAASNNAQAVSTYLERAMKAHPNELEPRLLLGRYYLSQGKAERVAQLFTSLDKMQRESPEVLRLLAVAQLTDKDHLEAQHTLEQLAETTPESVITHYLLAQALAGAGDQDEARVELQRALDLEPRHLASRLALARMELADRSMTAFEQQLAILVKQAPDNIEVLRLRSISAYENKDLAAAVTFSRQAFDQAPAQKTLLHLAGYLDAAGDTDAAIKLMRDWLKQNPADAQVRLALAEALGKSGQSGASLEQYRKVLDYEPDNFVALNNLAWEIRETNTEQALGYARRAVEATPDNAAALDTLAVVEYLNGDFRSARRSIQRALDRAPQAPSLLYHSAMIDNALGDRDSAAKTLRALLGETEDFPEHAEARTLLASLE